LLSLTNPNSSQGERPKKIIKRVARRSGLPKITPLARQAPAWAVPMAALPYHTSD
jgi:hypothetical protein